MIRTVDSISKAKLFRKSREDGHWTYRREDLNTFCIGRANLTLPTCRPKLHQAFPPSDVKPPVDLLMQYYCPPSMQEEKTSQWTVSEIRSFLSIFPTSNSFFPRTLILLTHVLTFAMISPHVLFPLFHFAFTIHTKSEPLRNISEVDSKDLPKTGAIYSRGSSPGTFSHLIPYRKASLIDSLDAHSSTKS